MAVHHVYRRSCERLKGMAMVKNRFTGPPRCATYAAGHSAALRQRQAELYGSPPRGIHPGPAYSSRAVTIVAHTVPAVTAIEIAANSKAIDSRTPSCSRNANAISMITRMGMM